MTAVSAGQVEKEKRKVEAVEKMLSEQADEWEARVQRAEDASAFLRGSLQKARALRLMREEVAMARVHELEAQLVKIQAEADEKDRAVTEARAENEQLQNVLQQTVEWHCEVAPMTQRNDVKALQFLQTQLQQMQPLGEMQQLGLAPTDSPSGGTLAKGQLQMLKAQIQQFQHHHQKQPHTPPSPGSPQAPPPLLPLAVASPTASSAPSSPTRSRSCIFAPGPRMNSCGSSRDRSSSVGHADDVPRSPPNTLQLQQFEQQQFEQQQWQQHRESQQQQWVRSQQQPQQPLEKDASLLRVLGLSESQQPSQSKRSDAVTNCESSVGGHEKRSRRAGGKAEQKQDPGAKRKARGQKESSRSGNRRGGRIRAVRAPTPGIYGAQPK
jgi:hypothetical protein